MIKNKSSIEVKVGERIYTFLCESDSAIHEVVSVLDIMKNGVADILKKSQEQQADAPPPPEESKE